MRRWLLLAAIAAAQFAVFEIALRTWGHSEAAPSFQALFMPDPDLGYRLRPNARTRFVTSEFDTHLAIDAQGVRDDRDIGAKLPNERRIVVLGDSLVLSVQVDQQQTFCSVLERRLNAGGGPLTYRVINAGVQGYGPVEELLFYRKIARQFQPDLVIETIFVGNDAEDAVANEGRLYGKIAALDALSDTISGRLRRMVRRSMVLQVLRLRVVSVTDRFGGWKAPAEPPLQSYAAHPAARIARGLDISARCVRDLESDAHTDGAKTIVMLMPARFQVDDGDYRRLKQIVRDSGGEIVRDAATERFEKALSVVGVPLFDALPSLRAAMPGPDVFFQQTVHLTPRGHEIVAASLEQFLRGRGLVDGL